MPPEHISFEDNSNFHIKSRAILGQAESPAMIRSLIKHGIVKNEKQAFYVILLLFILFMSLSAFIIYNTFYKQPSTANLSPEDQSILKGDLKVTQ